MRCSCLWVIACQLAIKGMLRNMFLLKTKEPVLLPSVVCIPALIACVAMDCASSKKNSIGNILSSYLKSNGMDCTLYSGKSPYPFLRLTIHKKQKQKQFKKQCENNNHHWHLTDTHWFSKIFFHLAYSLLGQPVT
jgi:hypothetical protein